MGDERRGLKLDRIGIKTRTLMKQFPVTPEKGLGHWMKAQSRYTLATEGRKNVGVRGGWRDFQRRTREDLCGDE